MRLAPSPPTPEEEGLPHERVWSLAFDRDGNLWIGTDGGGLARLRDGALTTFDTRNGLTNDFVWALHEDREGSLWVGTNGGGLNRLKNGAVLTLTTREGLPGDFVWSVLRDRAGSLWVGTEDAGVARIREDGTTRLRRGRRFRGRRARPARARRRLALDRGRPRPVRPRRRAVRPIPLAGHADDILQALAEDGSGTLWIGTVSDGLLALADGGCAPSPPPTAWRTTRSRRSCRSRTGRSGSERSAASVGGRPTAVGPRSRTRDGLPGNYVTALFEGRKGDLWAATRGGLARIRDGRVASLTAAQGLFDDALMSALPGDDGWIWMGSNRGLFASPLAEIEELFAGRRRPRLVALRTVSRTDCAASS